VDGRPFKKEIQVMFFFYPYVLMCADGDWYLKIARRRAIFTLRAVVTPH